MMTGRTKFLIGIAAVIAVICVVSAAKSWLGGSPLEILVQARPPRPPRPGQPARNAPTISFTLNGLHDLENVRLYRLDGEAEQLIWDLEPGDDPAERAPVQGFTYGQRLKGMKQVVPATGRPPLLENDVRYRLVVETGDGAAAKEFALKAKR